MWWQRFDLEGIVFVVVMGVVSVLGLLVFIGLGWLFR